LERLLRYNELHFSHPLRFNDPFDSVCLFGLKGSTREDWESFYANPQKELTVGEKEARISAALANDAKHGWRKSSIDRDRLHSVMRQGLEEVRILCLSERWDSLLMWAHYAAGHRGVCLRFNRMTIDRTWWCEKVRYRSDYPTLREFLATEGNGRLTSAFLLLNKAAQWRYEREWRAIAFTFTSKTEPAELPAGALCGVIFGCLTPPDDRARVASWLTARAEAVPLFHVRRHPDAYRLTWRHSAGL